MKTTRLSRYRKAVLVRVVPALKMANYWIIARFAMAALWLLRRLPPDRALDFAARLGRRVGPWFGRHRTAVDNLRHAYPEKSLDEIEAIALDMWSSMARLAAEYVFLDQLFDFVPGSDSPSRIEIAGGDLFVRLAAEDRPHILFTAHLGNFELLPIAAGSIGARMSALFRPPNNPYIARYILSTRHSTMGELVQSNRGVAFTLASILEKGGNIGVLVDQKYSGGLSTTFFGRPCETNPVVPILARRFDCDVYPTRCVRLSGNRYRIEVEEKLDLARNPEGDIDVQAATQQLNDVVERWVREDPGQWMWFHKRWVLSGRVRTKRRRSPLRRQDAGAQPP